MQFKQHHVHLLERGCPLVAQLLPLYDGNFIVHAKYEGGVRARAKLGGTSHLAGPARSSPARWRGIGVGVLGDRAGPP